MRTRTLALTLAATILSVSAAASTPLEDELKRKLIAFKGEASFPGMTVGFVLPDGRSGTIAIGHADEERKRELKPTDRMLAGSIGKTYAGALTLLLVQDKKLDLDAKIESWLGKEPWFEKLPNAKDLTLRMLMTHTSGIPEHVQDPAFIKDVKSQPEKRWTPLELLSYSFGKAPLAAAGEKFSYADTNYIVVGIIVEKVTGRPLYDQVKERLLAPLKLSDTIPSDRHDLPGVVTGHVNPNGPFGLAGPILKDGKFAFNPQCEWTGGGFASTAFDLARWAKELYSGPVITSATRDLMLKGVPANTGRDHQYGLATQIRPSPHGLGVGHGGWFPGYLSEMEYFPEHKIAVAVQFNTDETRRLGRSPRAYLLETLRIIREALAPKERASRPALSKTERAA